MKSHFLLFGCMTSLVCHIYAQAPDIQWQNTFGGSAYESASWIETTSGNGYIVGGTSESNHSPDKSENNLGSTTYPEDYWVVNLDSVGNIVWENTLGGERHDWFEGVTQASDGNFTVIGQSDSDASDDKSEDRCGGTDMWVVNLNPEGDINWENSISGYNYDYLRSFCKTDDGYLLAGNSASNISCDKTSDHYGYWDPHDLWIVKIDLVGNIMWQTNIGGDNTDGMRSVKQTQDGGFILVGYTFSSASFDITEVNHGYADIWAVKLNAMGIIEWQQLIGGAGYEYPTTVCETANGDFIIGAYSSSNISDDKSENALGDYDIWLIKLDAFGNTIWENTIGTTSQDIVYCITPVFDGNFVLTGYTSIIEAELDKTEIGYGSNDIWVIKFNTDGEFIWQKVLGGSAADFGHYIVEDYDYGLVIASSSASNISGVKTENSLGDYDFWVVKLAPECEIFTSYADADGDSFGNLFIDTLACGIPEGYVLDTTDCDDENYDINPMAMELCNLMDDNCNGLEDEGIVMFVLYADGDGDGFGNIDATYFSCNEVVEGYVLNSDDCNDAVAFINPDALETCNGFDENCNLLIDETLDFFMLYADADGDDFGNAEIDSLSCMTLDGYTDNDSDCDDTNANIYPGAPEILNGVDDNCDLLIDEGIDIITSSNNVMIKISPNPVSNILTITLDKLLISTINNMELINAEGKKVWQQTGTPIYFEINVNELAAGLYILNIQTPSTTIASKIIVEHK